MLKLIKNWAAWESLGEPVKEWNTILIYIITHKIDSNTFHERKEYKDSLDKNCQILFSNFFNFLRERVDLIETLELSNNSVVSHTNSKNVKVKANVYIYSILWSIIQDGNNKYKHY